jgi:hypothetical protein
MDAFIVAHLRAFFKHNFSLYMMLLFGQGLYTRLVGLGSPPGLIARKPMVPSRLPRSFRFRDAVASVHEYAPRLGGGGSISAHGQLAALPRTLCLFEICSNPLGYTEMSLLIPT